MDFSAATWWWMLAGILVAAELLTGTFYLLMLALGCATAAITAHAGMSSTAQVLAAAIAGGGATAGWYVRRWRSPAAPEAAANRDVNLDVGETVQVDTWGADGQARVKYRGAAWSVRYAGSGTPAPGSHVIVAVHGSRLDVAPR